MKPIIKFQIEHEFKYCESDFWNKSLCSDIERELVRFRWGNPKYRGHFIVYHKIHYFDEYIMDEIKRKVEDYNNKIQRGVLHERI